MRQLWTDDELDQALAELHADVRPNPNGLAAARERMLSGEPVRGRRFHRAWLPIVAATTVLGTLTVQADGGQVVAADPEQRFSMRDTDVRPGCADFDSVNPQNSGGRLPCVDQKGGWLTPTPDWLASLPKDAEALATKLKPDTPNGVGPLYMASYALRTGVFPRRHPGHAVPGADLPARRVPPDQHGNWTARSASRSASSSRASPTRSSSTRMTAPTWANGSTSRTAARVFLISAMRYGVVDKQGVTPK